MEPDEARPGVSPPSTAVVLVRPQEEGNVGAAARAMGNFGLERLVLVEPAVRLGATAYAFAVSAGSILDRSERRRDLGEALAEFGQIVATTAARGRPWPRVLVAPRDLAALLARDPPDTPTALVFGPERSGLTNDELALANTLVQIPSSSRLPTLNLAQAVGIVAYELYRAREPAVGSPAREPEPRAVGAEIAGFSSQLTALLHRVRFARDTTIVAVERDLRALVARASPTRREIAILRGILRRFDRALGTGSASERRGGRRGSG